MESCLGGGGSGASYRSRGAAIAGRILSPKSMRAGLRENEGTGSSNATPDGEESDDKGWQMSRVKAGLESEATIVRPKIDGKPPTRKPVTKITKRSLAE
jgi:hypothetical protein